ncbi:GntR family transcriptional regulator [Bordetella sp. BOR01]|uniref:GntR family transcriptional regulator n=1 Tax=Bordetella sp. BOR01 TaxID=2854779 RepID=UPI001C43DDD8|nr:GntR family transcriptional regulator [Bordetella sp. BOR01]MBV7482969.1 GntR family transcriptional regulator [Bordetella sp. BOR01]
MNQETEAQLRVLRAAGESPRLLSLRIRDAITEGVYLPGDKLTERELCERFSASRPSVREAIRQLDGEGLLEIAPHRGPAVRSVDEAQFHELHEVRVSLQRLAAACFANRGTACQMDAFSQRIDEFEQALVSRDVARIRAAKHQLFEAFVAGAQNEVLANFIRKINARLGFLWASSLGHPERPAESVDEFHRLLGAIRERDPEAAQAAIVLQNQRARAIGLHALTLFQARRRAQAGRAG